MPLIRILSFIIRLSSQPSLCVSLTGGGGGGFRGQAMAGVKTHFVSRLSGVAVRTNNNSSRHHIMERARMVLSLEERYCVQEDIYVRWT